MKEAQKKSRIWGFFKRIAQLFLTVIVIWILTFLFNFIGITLDDSFVFSKCLTCPPWFRFIFNYGFALLCLIGFIRIIMQVCRKKISKFWIFDGIVGLIVVGSSLILPIWSTYNLIKYPNILPPVLRVYPSDQTYVFYEGQIPNDKKENLTGFVIRKDNPIPLRYENGKVIEYESKTDNWYPLDDVERSEDLMTASHKTTHEPITGFVMYKGQGINVLSEYLNGKFTGNRFGFRKEDDESVGKLSMWLYLKGDRIVNYENYYPNGYLVDQSHTSENRELMGSWYTQNGQLVLKTTNQNLGADNPMIGVASLQQLYYNSKGQLVAYWDMRQIKALCVSPDGAGRLMMPDEIEQFFKEADKLPNGKIPEFWCDYQAKYNIFTLLKSLAKVAK